MTCTECIKRGKTWNGSDPVCAFPDDGEFQTGNWSCALAGRVRDIVGDDVHGWEGTWPRGVDYQYCDDMKYASVNISSLELEPDCPLCLWVKWYKNRGETDSMLLLGSGDPRPPTAKEVRAICDHYEAAIARDRSNA